jgi:hypothetical protein
MKKILLGFFVLTLLFTTTNQARASIVDDLMSQIQSLKTELSLLKSNQGANVLGATTDTTPRIMYWTGKINQHTDSNGVWQSDADQAGSYTDKLTYCKKFWPNTISVEPYMSETINTWRAGLNGETYTNTKVSDKCVQPTVASNTNKVNGGWSGWYNTGSCVDGKQTQIRYCTNPTPANGGAVCTGSATQIISCNSVTLEPYRAYSITQTSAILGINVTSLGSTVPNASLRIYYGTTPHPTTTYVTHPNALAVKIYEYGISNLTCDTTYYYYGSIGGVYSTDKTFTTAHCDNWVDTGLPVVSSPTATAISTNGVTLGASVTSPSTVSEYGVCYKKTGDNYGCIPTTTLVSGKISMPIYSLLPDTTYTYYAYAYNTKGEGKSALGTFTTTKTEVEQEQIEETIEELEEDDTTAKLPDWYKSPEVVVYRPFYLEGANLEKWISSLTTATTSSISGKISHYWTTVPITERGFCYGLSSSSINNCQKMSWVQGPNDPFGATLTGLTPNTKYYYRIYVKNSYETVYSPVETFTTKALTEESTQEDDSTPNTIDTTCTTGQSFNPVSGLRCLKYITTTENGCLPGYVFSPLTGKLCSSISTEDLAKLKEYAQQQASQNSSAGLTLNACSSNVITTKLERGSVGPQVKILQEMLNALGYLPDTGIDSKFGPGTRQAVVAYQIANKLPVDGIVGPKTMTSLNTQWQIKCISVLGN